jgi:Amt family ammonium transporter
MLLHTDDRNSDLPPAAQDASPPLHPQAILAAISDAVITTGPAGTIDYMNIAAERLTGWSVDEATGRPLQQVFNVVDESGHPEVDRLHRCLKNGEILSTQGYQQVLLNREGIGIAIEEAYTPILGVQGHVDGVVVVFRDVSQARKLTAQVNWQASHDTLTGLINRVGFDPKLEELLADAQAAKHSHSLLYVDLDQFKIVNDTCGHVAGDELLRQIAILLSSHVRVNDILARLGGDEFGVLLASCSETVAMRIANEMRQSIKEFRFEWQGQSFSMGASIGLVNINAQSEGVEQVMMAADAACYAAKDGGRNQVSVFQLDASAAARRQGEMQWVSRIQNALDENRFRLYAQAIVPVNKQDGGGHFEVLIRMLDQTGAVIPPGAFIPAAERFDLMPRIDRWVVNSVFELIHRERDRLVGGGYRFAINLSGGSVSDEETLSYIGKKLSEYEIPSGMISFEITETAAILNLASAIYFIRTLKQAGCSFSLDDFGSGLSSFAYLKNLPVDYLKIDGAFVKDMAVDPIDRAMVQAINQIGHVMELKTIAEFVENELILEQLRSIGVDYAQGYGIAKPIPLVDGDGSLLLPLDAGVG